MIDRSVTDIQQAPSASEPDRCYGDVSVPYAIAAEMFFNRLARCPHRFADLDGRCTLDARYYAG